MRLRRPVLTTLLATALGLTALCSSAAAAPKTVIFNMYPEGLVQPDRVFFQANSGPFLDSLQWSGWGTAQATGTGTYRLDCSNGGGGCAPGDPSLAYPARYVVGDLAPCPRFGAGARSYRSGTVEIDKPEGTKTVDFPSDYDFCAKPPTRKAAATAVVRYVERRLHGRRVRAACPAPSRGTSIECTARWTRSGRAKKRDFDVNSSMSAPLRVYPLGSA